MSFCSRRSKRRYATLGALRPERAEPMDHELGMGKGIKACFAA